MIFKKSWIFIKHSMGFINKDKSIFKPTTKKNGDQGISLKDSVTAFLTGKRKALGIS